MQTRRLGFWVYWLSAASLIAVIAPGVTRDAQVSAAPAKVAANVDTLASGAAATAPAAAPSENSSAAVAESPVVPSAAGQPDSASPGSARAGGQVGLASWYGGWHQGRLTASGERFDAHKLTAAHRTLPLDTKVKVTNLENGKSVEVKVNDRGPYVAGRVLDLSTQAAKQLGMEKEGLALVRIQVLPDQVADAVN